MDLAGQLGNLLGAGSLGALPAALAGGLITGLNPCCLALFPAAAATCCSPAGQPGGRMAVSSAAAFVSGMALSTTVLGVAAAMAGSALTRVGGWVPYMVALVPLGAGANMLGLLPFPAFRLPETSKMAGLLGAFLAGLLLSLIQGACGTPILAGILSFAAYKANIPFGALLLFLYGIGAGLPVLMLGTAAGTVAAKLDQLGRRAWVNRVAGLLLVGTGLYILWAG